MASPLRACRQFASSILRQGPQSSRRLPLPTTTANAAYRHATIRTAATPKAVTSLSSSSSRFFHTSAPRRADGDQPPPTDFGALDVLGNTPVPSTAIDVCMSDGFHLNSGARVLDGAGVLLVGGEAFSWRPWVSRGEKRLLNAKGQWEVPNDSLGLLGLLWPRPG